jgi:hypothetical protein
MELTVTRLSPSTAGRNRIIWILFILLMIISGASQAKSDTDDVIAILNGEPITLSQARERVAFQVFRLRSNIYVLLKRETEKIVDQKLLEAEAVHRKVTVEELLRREVDEKTRPINDQAVAKYLAENPREADRERVRIYLNEQSRSRRKSDFLASLREKAGYHFLLEPPRRPRTRIAIEGEPWRGNRDAAVTLIHFANFTDKLSAISVRMIQRLMNDYPGKIKWVHRNFFLINDESALNAALMGEFAYEQGKFWDYHDRIFNSKGRIGPNDVDRIANDLGLSRQLYRDGARAGRFLLKVKEDVRAASRIGVTSVPVIFVNGLYFSATFPFEQLQGIVSKELERTVEQQSRRPDAFTSN